MTRATRAARFVLMELPFEQVFFQSVCAFLGPAFWRRYSIMRLNVSKVIS